MDPKIIEDLETEEKELLAQLAIVQEKLRNAKAQCAVKRPLSRSKVLKSI